MHQTARKQGSTDPRVPGGGKACNVPSWKTLKGTWTSSSGASLVPLLGRSWAVLGASLDVLSPRPPYHPKGGRVGMNWQGLAARDATASRTLAWTGEGWEEMGTIWEEWGGVRSGVSWGPLGLSQSALGPTDAFGGRLGGLCGTSWGDLGGLLGRLWALLGRLGGLLGRPWGPLGPSWTLLTT